MIKPGSVVRMITGGPNLLVLKTTDSGLVICLWVANGLQCDLIVPEYLTVVCPAP